MIFMVLIWATVKVDLRSPKAELKLVLKIVLRSFEFWA